MKVHLFSWLGEVHRFLNYEDAPKMYVYIGMEELDVKPVKKWVKKEVQADSVRYWTPDDVLNGTFIGDYARNIKITYEVEE